jgi:hypothetical protein
LSTCAAFPAGDVVDVKRMDQVGLDLLLKTASKIYASSSGRRSASSGVLRSPAARRTGRNLQELGVTLFSFEGIFVRIWM